MMLGWCRSWRGWLAWIGLVAVVAAQPAEAQETEAQSGGSPPQMTELAPADLLPLEARSTEFRFTEGPPEGETVSMTLQRRGGEPGWVLTLEGYNRVYFHQAEDGALMMDRLDLIDRGEAVVYEPAVTLVPARIRPRVVTETTSRATVYNLESGEVQRTGTAHHRLEDITRARFQTPIGERTGYLVEINHDISFELAELRLRLLTGYELGHGIIYRRTRYTIDKLAVFGETTERTAEIAEEPTP